MRKALICVLMQMVLCLLQGVAAQDELTEVQVPERLVIQSSSHPVIQLFNLFVWVYTLLPSLAGYAQEQGRND